MRDDFELPQFPDFLTEFDLNNELFQVNEVVSPDGTINCPFIPLRDLILYPQMVMPLFIDRQRSLSAIQAATSHSEPIIVAAQIDGEVEDPDVDDIFLFGTEASVGRTMRMPDNSTSVLAQGRNRVEILEFTQWEPYMRVRARIVPEPVDWEPATEASMRAVMALFEKVVDLNRNLPDELFTFAMNIDEPGWLADFVASALSLSIDMRQDILETINPTARLQKVSILLAQELDVLELEDEIHAKVQQEVDRSQREHFLREQMRVIQGELGEMDVFTQELAELRQAIDQKKLPEEVRAKVDKELSRLQAMPPMSPEVGVIRTYLDLILDLPWYEQSEDNLDVRHAGEVLDADHFGLERIKDRILEFIAVKQIAPKTMRTPILCFVGPPGTGKTSLGRSIARALGRKFVRVSLGGVRDEAEIRGHRRTYIGAMPGRIVQAIRRAGTNNPLFMLDEIDKLGQDFRGDPSSALLEVLDPEQNNAFSDHYLELDFDLSHALFITTANWLDPIPPALRDRMEVIEFSGYLEEEKLEICRQFIIPRQIAQHGLLKAGLRFEEDALKMLIRQYTYEAGVRNLEREIANICRKTARRVAERRRYARRISAKQLEDLLGPAPITPELMREEDEVGVATGVAWTAAGGDILAIEVILMPGKGGLTLTGQMGEVMQESAQAALSYTRGHAADWGVSVEIFENHDVHIHIPEGSVPKDGPSAGVALVTALVSAFTNRPIRRDVGLTGEITLRGRVLPVGGIREKALAARRAGITTFVMPRKNENSLQKIPKKLRQDLNFILVERINEVLDAALLLPFPVPTPVETLSPN
ncbi:MAG: endopeptidase La [Anaerolineales bacterium]|nr:endopeptidase La [Anaerolineales bacterium]MCB8952279.1 endopeptidase La [Ardenticatenales bacterium]